MVHISEHSHNTLDITARLCHSHINILICESNFFERNDEQYSRHYLVEIVSTSHGQKKGKNKNQKRTQQNKKCRRVTALRLGGFIVVKPNDVEWDENRQQFKLQ